MIVESQGYATVVAESRIDLLGALLPSRTSPSMIDGRPSRMSFDRRHRGKPMNFNRRDCLSLATLLAAGTLVANPAFAAVPTIASGADDVTWVTLSSGHKVWTKRVGSSKTKVLLLHGGPGLSHDYLDCFAEFLPRAGFELHLYDQLGCGLSDRPKDPALWTLSRYIQEVEEVRRALELDQFILIGHSWGSMLAIEYALQNQRNLRALVLSNMTASAADYNAYNDKLKHELPTPLLKKVLEIEASGKFDDPEYSNIISTEYFPKYATRLKPSPAGLDHSFSVANAAIGNSLIGPDQYVFGGELVHWDRWADLHRIKVPTLTMGAKYDFMDPRSIEREAHLIPHGEYFFSETGSHLAMWDDQERYFAALNGFIGRHQA
jgi:proline iminopeptidase